MLRNLLLNIWCEQKLFYNFCKRNANLEGLMWNGMLCHALGGAVILFSLQHCIAPALDLLPACKPEVPGIAIRAVHSRREQHFLILHSLQTKKKSKQISGLATSLCFYLFCLKLKLFYKWGPINGDISNLFFSWNKLFGNQKLPWLLLFTGGYEIPPHKFHLYLILFIENKCNYFIFYCAQLEKILDFQKTKASLGLFSSC